MNLMEPIFLSLFANIIRMYAIYRCMEHFFLSKDENKISKICMYTGFVLVNSVGYYLFNNMFINISTNIIGLLFITTLYKCNFLKKLLMVVLIYIIIIIVESGVLYIFSYDMQTDIFWVSVYECITSMGILLIVVLLEKTISVKRKNSQIEGFLWVVIIITHRLDTISDVDKIFVMSEGRICEEGQHNELMKKGEKYYALVQNL